MSGAGQVYTQDYFSKYFYCDWLMIAMTLVAFIVGLKRHSKIKELKFITCYLGVLMLFTILSLYFEFFATNLFLEGILENLFAIIELAIFYAYLSGIICSARIRFVMKAVPPVFCSVALLAWFRWPFSLYKPCTLLFVFESILLVMPCLYFFYEWMIRSRRDPYSSSPPFWIVTGILFYNGCSIPIFLSADYIQIYSPDHLSMLLGLNYIMASIFSLLFLRAYLCRKRATY